MSAYPELLNEDGGTYHVGLTLAAEALQFIVLLVCGYVAALVAGRKEMKHCIAVTVVLLVIGVTVQMSCWNSMLIWHHFVFFTLIVVGVFLGTRLRLRQKGSSQSRVL
jgi:FtsH-binding integral membrane protein